MEFKITTLCDNTVAQGGRKLIGEHGLSFYIEAGTHKILFDTGQGIAISHNADVLGIDLSRVDTVVLSHGHDDHSGGLQSLLRRNSDFTLRAHPDVFGRKVKSSENGYQDIAVPALRELLAQNGIKIKLNKKAIQIAPGITSSGEIPLENEFEEVAPVFFTRNDDDIVVDTMADDQALVLDTNRGLVVLLGCSHRGVINTLNHVVRQAGKAKIYAVLGGLHLGKASEPKLRKVMEGLAAFDLQQIGAGHCTGFRAIAALYNKFPERVFLNTVGNKMIV